MTSPAQTQTTTAFNQMSSYYSDLSSYLSGESTTYPTASDYLSSLDYSELFTIAAQTQRGSPNYANGALIETIHHITAVQRELGLGSLTKYEHYLDAQSDGTTESEYYTMLSNQYGYMVSGLGTAAVSDSTGVTT
jgi:hypothetical protein